MYKAETALAETKCTIRPILLDVLNRDITMMITADQLIYPINAATQCCT